MDILVMLVQYNNLNEKKVTFEATKKVSYAEKNAFSNVSKQIANFCKETIEFTNRSKQRGVNISLLKKSQPIDIVFESEKKEVTISFKNFGKFVEQTKEEDIAEQIKDSFKFVDKFANWEKA